MMRPFRAFSDYLYEAPIAHYLLSLEDFHQAVHRAISNHKKCQTQYSIRACAYNASLEHYKVMREREREMLFDKYNYCEYLFMETHIYYSIIKNI